MRDNDETYVAQNIDIFCCPQCGGGLTYRKDMFSCHSCHKDYPVIDGIPSLFCRNQWDSLEEDVTDEIKSFYEENPFPNYDGVDDVASLKGRLRRGNLAKLLDDQVPFGARILECGCGTGQLSNILSIDKRTVLGTDICINSLRMANRFKHQHDLRSCYFYQMNLFRPCFKPKTFDLVISNGVLHHTSNPFLAFKSISNLVKPNGYIVIGLYHKYGRLATDLRRTIFNVTGDKLKWLDRRTTNEDINSVVRNTWFLDQYKNPHESKHTVGEILRWLDSTGFEFIRAIPKTVPFSYESVRLFKPDKLGNVFQRLIVNIGMIFSGHREGGFFVVVAKKK